MTGRRGRKPKDEAVKERSGNPGKRGRGRPKKDTGSSQTKPAAIKVKPPPDWLGEYGKAIWKDSAPKLAQRNLLTEIDYHFFALYCSAWDDFRAALDDIEANGDEFTTEKGYVGQRPNVQKKNNALKFISLYGSKLGLSPDSRRGLDVVSTETAKSTNPLKDVLGKKE